MTILVALAACAAAPSVPNLTNPVALVESGDAPDAPPSDDPLESLNRALYSANSILEHVLIAPVAYAYRHVVPALFRHGIRNILANASAPVVFAAHLGQAKACRAGDTFVRFVLNTTAGLGGLIDIADRLGIPAQTTSFGTTFGVWGVAPGPYLFLPVVTSMDARDFVGLGVELAMDPWSWAVHGAMLDDPDWGRLSMAVVDATERWIDPARKMNSTEVDPYVAFRSMYLQMRQNDIAHALAPDSGVICGDAPPP